MRVIQTPNIEEVAKKIEQQYLLARTLDYIEKPLSYAIHKVWEEYNRHEEPYKYHWKGIEIEEKVMLKESDIIIKWLEGEE